MALNSLAPTARATPKRTRSTWTSSPKWTTPTACTWRSEHPRRSCQHQSRVHQLQRRERNVSAGQSWQIWALQPDPQMGKLSTWPKMAQFDPNLAKSANLSDCPLSPKFVTRGYPYVDFYSNVYWGINFGENSRRQIDHFRRLNGRTFCHFRKMEISRKIRDF